MHFYARVLKDLLDAGTMRTEESVLAVCGGPADADSMREAGFTRGTISNLDTRMERDYTPFDWSRQDAENLTFAKASFDWCIVHAGLHHCPSPHRAMLEMYRVCRRGLIVMESADSLLMRLAVHLKLTEEYEFSGLLPEDKNSGSLPNFVYRWTEREVYKTIESADPPTLHGYRFLYGFDIPPRLQRFAPLLKLLPNRLGNRFGFIVTKHHRKAEFA